MLLNNFKELIIIDEVTSTNDYIKTLPIGENYIVIAKSQTNGKGTKGRSFYSPKGKGLYLSFTDNFKEYDSTYLVALVALSFVKTINKLYQINLDIKWINDLYYQGKKLGGILVETIFNGNKWIKTIFGLGINLYYTNRPFELENKIISLDEFISNFNEKNIINDFFRNYNEIKKLSIEEVKKFFLKKVIYITS